MTTQSQQEGSKFAEYIVSLAEDSVTLRYEFIELINQTPDLNVDEFIQSAVSAFERELKSVVAG